MENRNRDTIRRSGADTELEPSEEFPILYSLLTAPKSHKPKSREQMRDWHNPVAIEADSSLALDDDYDSSPSINSFNDDSQSAGDENDMSLIFNYVGSRPIFCNDNNIAVLEEDDDESADDDNRPTSTTSPLRKTVAIDLSRRQFHFGRRPSRRRNGRILQREKISTRGDMPLLEAMITSSPKISTTSEFDVRKLNEVIGRECSSPTRSPTRRILSKSATNSSPPTLVPAVNITMKVQSSSQNGSENSSYTTGSNNEVFNVRRDPSIDELCNQVSKDVSGEESGLLYWQSKSNGNLEGPQNEEVTESLLLHPHLAKALRMGRGRIFGSGGGAEEDRPYKCSECDLSFKTATLLSRHTQTHLRDQTFHCEFCSNTFRRKDNMLAHIRTSCKGRQMEQRSLALASERVQNACINRIHQEEESQRIVANGFLPRSCFPKKISLADFMNSVNNDTECPSLISRPGISSSTIASHSTNVAQTSKLPLDLEIEEVDIDEPTPSKQPCLSVRRISKGEHPPNQNRRPEFNKSISSSVSSISSMVQKEHNVPTMRKLLCSASVSKRSINEAVQPQIYHEPQSEEIIKEKDDSSSSLVGLVSFPCGHCNGIFRSLDRLLKHTKSHIRGRIVERVKVSID